MSIHSATTGAVQPQPGVSGTSAHPPAAPPSTPTSPTLQHVADKTNAVFASVPEPARPARPSSPSPSTTSPTAPLAAHFTRTESTGTTNPTQTDKPDKYRALTTTDKIRRFAPAIILGVVGVVFVFASLGLAASGVGAPLALATLLGGIALLGLSAGLAGKINSKVSEKEQRFDHQELKKSLTTNRSLASLQQEKKELEESAPDDSIPAAKEAHANKLNKLEAEIGKLTRIEAYEKQFAPSDQKAQSKLDIKIGLVNKDIDAAKAELKTLNDTQGAMQRALDSRKINGKIDLEAVSPQEAKEIISLNNSLANLKTKIKQKEGQIKNLEQDHDELKQKLNEYSSGNTGTSSSTPSTQGATTPPRPATSPPSQESQPPPSDLPPQLPDSSAAAPSPQGVQSGDVSVETQKEIELKESANKLLGLLKVVDNKPTLAKKNTELEEKLSYIHLALEAYAKDGINATFKIGDKEAPAKDFLAAAAKGDAPLDAGHATNFIEGAIFISNLRDFVGKALFT